MKPIHKIFYSWQSNLSKETNQNAIRQSLRDSANKIENVLDNVRIEIDEATRNTTGSPNIPQTIFEKIILSDVFVCDLTTINNNCSEIEKRVPNPNVLIELGFAVATLGWERIIMVFNTNYGTFPNDLPFDIDRHRATKFSVVDKNDKNGKSQLTIVLTEAIKAILESSPLKPNEKRNQTPEETKRKINIINLKLALETIHIPTFDRFIQELPETIIHPILYFKSDFLAVVDSNTFHVYDNELASLIDKFKITWIKSLSFSEHYMPDRSSKNYRFYLEMDTFQSAQAERDFYKIIDIRKDLYVEFKNLLFYTRNNYLEIDLAETSSAAFERYKSAMNQI